MDTPNYQPSNERYSRMDYRYCGKSGLQLSPITLGLWHNFGSNDDFGLATRMITYAFDHGITHFDLANNYGPVPGSAETNFGRIVKSHLWAYRDELIISTKAGHEMWPGPYGGNSSRKNLMASIDQSLRRTGLDYFDIFYSHRYDGVTPVEETVQALIDIVKQGKSPLCRYFQISAPTGPAGLRNDAGGRRTVPGEPIPLQPVRAVSRERKPPAGSRLRVGLRSFLAAGTGFVDRQIPERHPPSLARGRSIDLPQPGAGYPRKGRDGPATRPDSPPTGTNAGSNGTGVDSSRPTRYLGHHRRQLRRTDRRKHRGAEQPGPLGRRAEPDRTTPALTYPPRTNPSLLP